MFVNVKMDSSWPMTKEPALKQTMTTHPQISPTKFQLIRQSMTKFNQDVQRIGNFNLKKWLFRDCPSGYIKNEQTGKCEDIDECEGTDATCNIETQVCHNTPGSYECLDINRPSTSCPNGFRFDSKIKQCLGT